MMRVNCAKNRLKIDSGALHPDARAAGHLISLTVNDCQHFCRRHDERLHWKMPQIACNKIGIFVFFDFFSLCHYHFKENAIIRIR